MEENKNTAVETTTTTTTTATTTEIPGHGAAVGALVLGIISCVSCCTGIGAIVGLVLGIIGISKAKKALNLGNTEGIRKAGYIMSIIGVCVAGAAVVIVLLGIGTIGAIGLACM